MATRYQQQYAPPEFYGGGSRGGGSIADIIMRGGDAQAQAHLARGQMWADTFRGIGQTIGSAIEENAKQKEVAKRDAAWLSFIDSGEWQDPKKAALGTLQIWGPGEEGQAQLRALGGIMQLGQQKRDPEADQKALTAIGSGMARMTDSGRAMAWPQAHALLQRSMPELAAQLPEQYDPKVWQEISPLLSGPAGQPSAPVKVGQGDSLVDPATGKVIFAGQPKPEAPLRLGEGDVLIDPTTGKRIAAGPPKTAPAPKPVDTAAADRIADAWAAGLAFPSTQDATSMALESFARRGMPTPRKLSASMQADVVRAADTLQTLDDVEALYSRVKGKVGPVSYRFAEWGQKIPGVTADPDFAAFNAMLRGMGNLEIKRITGAQMSESEADRLLKAMATGTMKAEEFEAALGVMRRNAQRNRDVMLYGAAAPMGGGSPAGGGPVKVRTPEEARKLPSGTLFQAPDGRTMRVP